MKTNKPDSSNTEDITPVKGKKGEKKPRKRKGKSDEVSTEQQVPSETGTSSPAAMSPPAATDTPVTSSGETSLLDDSLEPPKKKAKKVKEKKEKKERKKKPVKTEETTAFPTSQTSEVDMNSSNAEDPVGTESPQEKPNISPVNIEDLFKCG